MIALVAPEPVPWLAPLAAVARDLGEVEVFAPWALRGHAPSWFPVRLRAALERRAALPRVATRRVPGWLALEAGLGAWAGSRADRLLTSRFARRRVAGPLVARGLPANVRMVVAPSLAARRPFAVAAPHGAVCVLVEDLPDLRGLHLDLDRAAACQPGDGFLRRYRAPAPWLVEQEAERALAHLLLVRSRFALEERLAAGFDPRRVLSLPDFLPPASRPPRRPDGARRALLLAGPATARSGLSQALAAAARIPGTALLVRPGDGSPADLLRRSGVRAATREERELLEGVDLVLAPALCESHPPEVARAAAAGIPVVATYRAAGFVDLARAGHPVEPGDLEGLLVATRELLGARMAPAPPGPSWPAVATRLRELLAPQAGTASNGAPPIHRTARGSP